MTPTEHHPTATVAQDSAGPLPPVVSFSRVTKSYEDGFTAIKDVSFVVEDTPNAMELITILGPSGCGKSTILRLIAGLTPQHPATSGEVLVLGRRVAGPGADRGMVFQDYTSFDNRTVLDNVAFGLECRGVSENERHDAAREWIGKVGLDVARDAGKYPHQLSGGMRQRVAIARTLILHPKIVLMDEPFGALDPRTRLNMQDLLVSLARETQATVFFVTHDIEEAVYLGDRTFIISSAPGTIMKAMAVPPPDFPARVMQRKPEFMEVVYEIRELMEGLESFHARRRRVGVRKYFRAAFLYPWNMLFFLGGLGVAAMSPWPDAAIPVAVALEIAYLTGLTAIPRFRLAVDAKLAAQARGDTDARTGVLSADAQLHRLITSLPADSLRRFLLLRQRCTEMRDIATGVMGRTASNNDSADSIRTPALDRLLFLFLKLLVSQAGLERFLKSTSGPELALRLKDVQQRLVTAQAAKDERVTASLTDSVADAQLRVDNYAKSKSDADFVSVELDRIETKIQALIEMGVSRQDPETFSSEVSAAADSMAQTEDAVKQLHSLSGLADQMQDPPAILSADLGPRVLNAR